jgi:hypothetical protein
MKMMPFIACTLMFALFSSQVLNAQLLPRLKKPDIMRDLGSKVKEVVADKMGDKAMSDWLSNAPVSTGFDQAIYEVGFLSDFEPSEEDYAMLASQPYHKTEGFMLSPGAYTMQTRSFCLKAGTYGPSHGDGHLYAPLKGKSADFVQQILWRYGQNPQVPQGKVQVLLWAVIAGADMNTLADEHQQTLYQLFTIGDLARFKAKHSATSYARTKIAEFSVGMRTRLAPALEAESKMRDMVRRANVAYDEFERVAMLSGEAPMEDMVRQVSRGRWSYHPDGYFVRYFPNGYKQTRVDVFVPEEIVEEMDSMDRIVAFQDPLLGRIELEYNPEIYAAGSVEGYNQYVCFATSMRIGSEIQVFAKPIPLPFITTERFSTTRKTDGQAELDHCYKQVLALQNMGGPATGRCPPPSSSPVMLSRLLTALRWAYQFSKAYKLYNDLSKCCEQENLQGCVLAKVAGRYLPNKVKQHLQQSSGLLPNLPVMGRRKTVVFDPSSSVAVPANRASQRIGISPIPVLPPHADWLAKIPPCPCLFDDASGLTESPKGQWLQCTPPVDQDYHYGAAYETRWVPATKGGPGQQCTYDQNKKLIGYGLAAGTADFSSPGICGAMDDPIRSLLCPTNVSSHLRDDVINWYNIPCEDYSKLRPSSNELCLDKNPVNDWHFGQMCQFVKDFSCPEIRDLFLQFRDAENVPPAMRRFMEKGQLEGLEDAGAILEFLKISETGGTFSFADASWRRIFVDRVSEYLEYYKKTGKNPSACPSP